MRKVLIPTKLDAVAKELLTANGYEVIQQAGADLASLAATHSDAAALIVRSEKVTEEIINALPNLKLVVRAGAGYNTIDTKYARRRDVDVMNTPGANANAVAEEVVALILAAYRHVVRGDTSTRAGDWEKSALMGRELTGKTVGIVGLGNIGQLLVKRLSGFEVRVIAYDPMIATQKAKDLDVELMPIEQLFSEADIVSLHIPETNETRGLINRDLLSLMKDGAMVVNCARAGVINEADFLAVKAEKKIIYCNDVYPKDEAGPKSVAAIADVMLPHLGASTQEANYNAAKRAGEQMMAYFERGVTTAVVNRGVPEGLNEDYQLLAFYLSRIARKIHPAAQPRRVETSFYGDLREYSKWLLGGVVLGLASDFDPLFDYQQAVASLSEKGITHVDRTVDDTKNYGNAMTVDLMEGKGNSYSCVSVRGTITEGKPMVSRINDFDRLYFDPVGHSLFVLYHDQPGMIAHIASVMAKHEINIDDIRSPHDARTGDSLAVLKVNKAVPEAAIADILSGDGFKLASYLHI